MRIFLILYLSLVSIVFANAPHRAKKIKVIKIKRGARGSIFLVSRGLPNYSYILKRFWDSKELNLKREQKRKLFKLREDIILKFKKLRRKISKLDRVIKVATKAGKTPEEIFPLIDELAKLKAQATKIKIESIYKTKEILTPEQLEFIENYKLKRRNRGYVKRLKRQNRIKNINGSSK
jgi:hypothetical protein